MSNDVLSVGKCAVDDENVVFGGSFGVIFDVLGGFSGVTELLGHIQFSEFQQRTYPTYCSRSQLFESGFYKPYFLSHDDDRYDQFQQSGYVCWTKSVSDKISFVCFLLLMCFSLFSVKKVDDGWKLKLKIPPKDTRIKTSVSICFLFTLYTHKKKVIRRVVLEHVLRNNSITKLTCLILQTFYLLTQWKIPWWRCHDDSWIPTHFFYK